MIHIYAFRHGPVKSKGVCYGQIDVETALPEATSLAQIQAALADMSPIDAVWTSPLARCRLLADAFGMPYQIDERLKEVSFGRWEGMSWADIYKIYPQEMDAWGANWFDVAPPGGESAQMLETRVKLWVNSLTSGTHLVFTHAGVIRSLRVICQLDSWASVIKSAVPYLGLESFTYTP